MKLIIGSLLAVVMAVTGITTATSSNTGKIASNAGLMNPPLNRVPPNIPLAAQDADDTIDGSQNPEKIPDHVAYSLFLRFLSGRHTEAEKKRARSYLQMNFGSTDCSNPAGPIRPNLTIAQIESLLAAAEEYSQRVTTLDRKAKEARDLNKSARSLGAIAEIGQLRKEKEALVTEMILSLPRRLGADGAELVRRHIGESVKRKVKIKGKPTQQASTISNVA